MTLVSTPRAILFADVSGSTELYEKLGNKPAKKAIDLCLNELRGIVGAHQGQVVKEIGDELMVMFGKAETALQAAAEMQQRVTVLPPIAGVKLAIRIGFHLGQVLEDEENKGDFWGDAVNVAARLAGLAKAGQVLTSSVTVNTLPPAQRDTLRDLGAISVKGKQDAVHVYELLWGDTDDATQLVGRASSARRETASSTRLETKLTLSAAGRTLVFPPDKNVLVLGRDKICDFVVEEKTASRRHARIERKGLQYFLVDESTNGTYVAVEGDREVVLSRDRLLLGERGKIALGTSTSSAAASISFECS
jgi:adenylate cyclase